VILRREPATAGEASPPQAGISLRSPPPGRAFGQAFNGSTRATLRPNPQPLVIDMTRYFCKYRNMPTSQKKNAEQVAKFADMFSAMGTEPRLRIMQLLLSAHPEGMVVGEIQSELDIPNSTLSHHLDKLRNEGLVLVSRESTFLRYSANTEALQEVLQFLYAECCTRNKAVAPRDVIQICK
jgi:DNA-binding transcriptional ArsR family regulator